MGPRVSSLSYCLTTLRPTCCGLNCHRVPPDGGAPATHGPQGPAPRLGGADTGRLRFECWPLLAFWGCIPPWLWGSLILYTPGFSSFRFCWGLLLLCSCGMLTLGFLFLKCLYSILELGSCWPHKMPSFSISWKRLCRSVSISYSPFGKIHHWAHLDLKFSFSEGFLFSFSDGCSMAQVSPSWVSSSSSCLYSVLFHLCFEFMTVECL